MSAVIEIRFRHRFRWLTRKMENELASAIENLGIKLVQELKERSPKRTGRFAESWFFQVRSEKGGWRLLVDNNLMAKYKTGWRKVGGLVARQLEFTGKPYVSGKLQVFEKREGEDPFGIGRRRGDKIVVFTYFTSGSPPKPFIRQAFRDVFEEWWKSLTRSTRLVLKASEVRVVE